jgi:hypothetical protein
MNIKKDKVLSKLTVPTHISYIPHYLLKTNKEEGVNIVKKYVEDGILEQSPLSKDYYVLKSYE